MNSKFFLSIIIVLLLGSSASNLYLFNMIRTEKASSKNNSESHSDRITMLENQITLIAKNISDIAGQNSKFAKDLKDIADRPVVKPPTQDDILTDAVAKVAPSVVSIVVSKDVPLLEVVYQNPFGDDPFFRDFGYRVPVYRQKGTEKRKVGAGTGFVITENGYIITNKHVVSDINASYTALLSNGDQKEARVVYRDNVHDLAILKITASKLKPAKFGDSSGLKLGQSVVAIGNALGEYSNSVSTGIISGLHRNISASTASGESEQLKDVIQTDTAINPGNSGGPLINTEGEVIGINVATVIGGNDISFAMPVNILKPIILRVLGTGI